MKLHIAICDDETVLCEETKKKILEVCPDYEIEQFFSGKRLLASALTYDMIFLDIEMPGLNGMETAGSLRKQGYLGHIIFLTGYTEYMPDAFKVKAFRFLTKPVNMDALEETLNESEREIFEHEKIVVDGFGTEILVDMKDIIYIEAMKKNSVLYLTNKSIETPYALKYWLEKLSGKDFCQVHKSFIVSLGHIVQVEEDEVILHGGDCHIPLSRRRHSIVRQAFLDYIKRHARIM